MTMADFDVHPIWFHLPSENPEIDFVFVPVLGAHEITDEVCAQRAPHFSLQIENSDFRCSAYYDKDKDTVFAIALWMLEEWRGFTYVDAPRTPVVLVARVPILGARERRFRYRSPSDWYAEKI